MALQIGEELVSGALQCPALPLQGGNLRLQLLACRLQRTGIVGDALPRGGEGALIGGKLELILSKLETGTLTLPLLALQLSLSGHEPAANCLQRFVLPLVACLGKLGELLCLPGMAKLAVKVILKTSKPRLIAL